MDANTELESAKNALSNLQKKHAEVCEDLEILQGANKLLESELRKVESERNLRNRQIGAILLLLGVQ